MPALSNGQPFRKQSPGVLRWNVADVYRPMFDDDNHEIVLPSGRTTGKTKQCILFILVDMILHPGYDWFVFKATTASIESTVFSEFLKEIDADPLLRNMFTCRTHPYRISRKDGRGIIYFKGADSVGGNDNKTKGLRTLHTLKGYMVDEMQEFKDKNAIRQLKSSITRNYSENGFRMPKGWKALFLWNPPKNPYHWTHDYLEECRRDKTITIIHATYLDILPFINDGDIRDILKLKMLDPEDYRARYLGIIGSGDGDVYPMVRESILQRRDEVVERYRDQAPLALIIGCDGAVERDETVFSVGLLMQDGRILFSQRDSFVHNPKKDGVIPSYGLCSPGGPAYRWFYGGIMNNGQPYQGLWRRFPKGGKAGNQSIPMFFIVDDAAVELKHVLSTFYKHEGISFVSIAHKSTITHMVEVNRNAYFDGKITFINDGYYMDYHHNDPRMVKSRFVAFDQVKNLKWNDKRNGYDDTIPNDHADSVTYPIWRWFRQMANLAFGEKMENLKI